MIEIDSKQLPTMNFTQHIQKKPSRTYCRQRINEVLEQYGQYSQKTSEGVHGKVCC